MLQRVLTLLAVLGLTIGATGTAFAGVFDAGTSSQTVRLGGLAPLTISGTYTNGGTAQLSGGSLQLDAGVFVTTGLAAGTTLFTGVDLITDLVLTASNQSATFTGAFSAINSVAGNLTGSGATAYSGTICPSGCLGGLEVVSGQTVVLVGGGLGAGFPNTVIGIGGTETLMVTGTQGPATIAATGGPFVTGKVRITNITSNVVQLPGRVPIATGPAVLLGATSMEEVRTFTTMGGFLTSNTTGQLSTVATVTIAGSNNVTGTGVGQVTLVSPLRIDTGPLNVGNIPGIVSQTFVFVPEPGTLLLLASGAAGLVMLGRRRSRK